MLYDEIIKIVTLAGELMLQAQDEELTVFDKEGTANFVTKHDKEIQFYLIQNLRQLIPEATFLAEEDFIFDYNHSCISVGLTKFGIMLFGCVYNPYTREMYSAVKGEGAKLNGKEIHCSDKGLADNLVAFGTARYQTEDTDRIFDHAKKLYLNSLGIRAGGSAALDICRVASGANGVYLELMLYPWDYAAASLIVMEAGGFISTAEGGMITLDQPCSILAAGRQCWKEASQLLSE